MDIMNKYIELCEIVTKNLEHITLMDITCFEESILIRSDCGLNEKSNLKGKTKIIELGKSNGYDKFHI